ncbi:MAG: hypothetical protein R6V85_10115, partial [Polyangia bacterium]
IVDRATGEVWEAPLFVGVPAATVPDNEKTAVTAPCLYEPDANPTYEETRTNGSIDSRDSSWHE